MTVSSQRIPEARDRSPSSRSCRVPTKPGQPRHAEVEAVQAVPREVDERHRRREQQHRERRRDERERETALPRFERRRGPRGTRPSGRRQPFSMLLDARLRLVQRFLGRLLADERGLDRRRHRLADRRPLRHARTPVDVGVLLQRFEGRRDEVVARVLHRRRELRRAPQRDAVDAGPLGGPRELPRRARLRLGRRRPQDEQPRRLLLLVGQRGVDRGIPSSRSTSRACRSVPSASARSAILPTTFDFSGLLITAADECASM